MGTVADAHRGLGGQFQRSGSHGHGGGGRQDAGGPEFRAQGCGTQPVVGIETQAGAPVARAHVEVSLEPGLVGGTQGPARIDGPAEAQRVARDHLVPALSHPLLHHALDGVRARDGLGGIEGHAEAHDAAGLIAEPGHAQTQADGHVRVQGPGRLAFQPVGGQVDAIAEEAAGRIIPELAMAQVGFVELEAEGQLGRDAQGQPEGPEGAVAVGGVPGLLIRFEALLARGQLHPAGQVEARLLLQRGQQGWIGGRRLQAEAVGHLGPAAGDAHGVRGRKGQALGRRRQGGHAQHQPRPDHSTNDLRHIDPPPRHAS